MTLLSRYFRKITPIALATGLALGAFPACSKDNEVDQSTNVNNTCTTPATDLAKLCPPGTAVDITGTSAVGDAACPSGEGEVKDAQGKTTGVCRTLAGCSVRCKATCECGVKSATTSSVECAPCATCVPGEAKCNGETLLLCGPDGKQASTDCAKAGQVCSSSLRQCVAADKCGNGVCEKEENETQCPADCSKTCGDKICSALETAETCPEDCKKISCGDGKCEMGEQQSCPQDCGSVCVSGAKTCVGAKLIVCQPDGKAEKEYNCADFDQTCGGGACVPKGVCGNGACEPSDPAGCADCATTCGDGTCSPGETVETCSSDCKKATCGDSVCSVSEAGTGCADCAKTCGDGACADGETRSTCPFDCGYCGDNKCPSNEETSVQPAPEGLEYCPQDCIKTGCSGDGDCDDGVECTVDRCVGGKCAYDAPPGGSGSCGEGSLCVKLFGCCPDADGDGYPCCGGDAGKGCKAVSALSDCDDQDGAVHPGAAEECGGPDRNCNGKNEPVVNLTPTVVTSDLDDKSNLAIAFDGSRYFLAWGGKPKGTGAVMGALIDKKGAPIVAPKILNDDPTYVSPTNIPRTRAAVAPVDKGFAVAWGNEIAPGGSSAGILWVNDKLEPLNSPQKFPGVWNDYLLFAQIDSYYALSGAWIELNSEVVHKLFSPNKTEVSIAEGSKLALDVAVFDKKFIYLDSYKLGGGFQPLNLRYLSTDGAVNNLPLDWGALTPNNDVNARIAYQRYKKTDAFAILSPASPQGLDYVVVNQGGKVISQLKVSSKKLSPEKAIYAAPPDAPDDGTLGVLAREGDNLVFLARKSDGTELLADKIVGGGPGTSSPALFFDGSDFVVFWLMPDKNNVQQVHLSRVTCE